MGLTRIPNGGCTIVYALSLEVIMLLNGTVGPNMAVKLDGIAPVSGFVSWLIQDVETVSREPEYQRSCRLDIRYKSVDI